MTTKLVSRGRHIIQAIVQREASTLLEAVTGARDAFRSSLEEALSLSEQRCLESFQTVYPRLYGHVKDPLKELFVSLKASLNAVEEGTVERALSSFWDELFPYVYHSTVHSQLPPFSHGYMECLRKSRRTINPWKVVPNLIGESLSKGLDTARLMMHALNVGSDVILNARSYEIPEECGAPAARLHFCSSCHGAVVPPCSGLCLNVARGCLAPLAEIDGAWADLGSAAMRVEESIRNSGLSHLLKDLPDRFSDAIMIALESGTKLQKMVRSRCGPHNHEESEEWEQRSKEGKGDKLSIEGDPDALGSLMELRASEAADILSGSREFWLGLADGACAHLSAQDTNCWNGLKVATYSRPAASVGVSAQKYNPEVQVSKPDTTVYALADQLRAVKRLVTKQLTWMPESDSFKKGDPNQDEGSGSDPIYKNHDDEDAEDDGLGSGYAPEIEKKEKELQHSADVSRSSLSEIPSVSTIALISLLILLLSSK
ncbi:UNVERIFIED_CONTAM: hypothetical protein RMT77_004738 [Armadillidium vulgare]